MSGSSRRRWRKHFAERTVDRFRGDRSGIWKHCEFFWEYLKFTTRAEWEGALAKQPVTIWYLLETHDDWANAPPDVI
jgi:hypothetical protein